MTVTIGLGCRWWEGTVRPQQPQTSHGLAQSCVDRENQGSEDDRRSQLQLAAHVCTEEAALRQPDRRASPAWAAVGDTLRTPPPAHHEGSSYSQKPVVLRVH